MEAIQTNAAVAVGSKGRGRVGAVLSGVGVAFLAFDGVIKLLEIAPVVTSFHELGYPISLARGIGAFELALLGLYLFPRTALVGAVLWTGYLGGAVATHLRLLHPLLSHTLFPIYIAALLWGGLWLRNERLRGLFAAE
jgi:hypothetical protein